MLHKTMDYIIKFLTVIGIGLLLLLFPGLAVIGAFVSPQVINTLFYVIIISFFTTGVTLVVLLLLFGIKLPQTKAEERELQFNHFDEFQFFLEKTLLEDGYLKQDMFFFKRKPFANLKCVVMIRGSQLSEDGLAEANTLITERLVKESKHGVLNSTVDLIAIMCVDRITPTFEMMVNSNLQQHINLHRLFVGVCFDDKKFTSLGKKMVLQLRNIRSYEKIS